ncbi:MAG TPA: endonuclease/exonuclease/phosphatase family protein, partial [Vicinamibacteria bacterium]|nr:endonuclease/exonuclease/phosphatase family protein [Vicinamibacteria bacterium]
QPFYDDGTHGDVIAGDLAFTFLATVPAGTPAGLKTLPVAITDAQARTGRTTIGLFVEPSPLAIHAIQGAGTASPYAGQLVATSGIVTGLKSNGFFLQAPDAEADADPSTSEGVFVFTGSAPPAAAAVGNAVRVTGRVQEFVPASDPSSPPLSEIAGSPAVTLLSAGNPLPEPVPLTALDADPAGSIEQLEGLEGMRVRVESLTVVGPTGGSTNETAGTATSNGVFYGVLAGIARPFREAGIETPDPLPPGAPCCVPVFDANPERLRVDSDGQPGALALDVAAGQVVTGLVGPLDYGFRSYTLLPDPGTPPSVTGDVRARAVPEPAADEVTVASFNLLRFFDDVNDPAIGEPVLTSAAFAGRLQKASLVIREVLRSPDILGVQEAEGLPALQALAARLDADTVAGGGADPGYEAYLVEGNDVGGIDVGFLVKSARVAVVDVAQEGRDETFVNPITGAPELLNDRPPLVLRARFTSPGGFPFPLTVIVNHLRSLSGVDDPAEGPRVRAKRRAQAEYLAGLIQARQLDDPAERIVAVGDFNAYQVNDGYVDPLGTIQGAPTSPDEVVLASPDLVDPDLANLLDTLPPGERYSYVFDGNAHVFDHVLVSSGVLPLARGLHYGRAGADFPTVLSGDPTRPERLSDHDAPIAYLRFPLADLAVSKTASPAPVLAGSTLTSTIVVANDGPDPATTVALTDTLPAGTTFRSLAAPPGWTCTVPPPGGSGGFTCTTPGLAAGSSAAFGLEVDVDCDLPTGTALANVASVAALTDDPDAADNAATATVTVSNPPPVVTGVAATPSVVWPPNHEMVEVGVAYEATDTCGLAVCRLAVTSDEPVNGLGDGDTAPDWTVVDAGTVRLRAERAGGGDGRVYTIAVACADAAGGATVATTAVYVPKSQKK